MLIKLVPEDFEVRERTSFEPSPKGPVSIYEVRKRKIDTFEAMRRIAAKAEIPLDGLSYLGLKDRQGITTQHISVTKGHIPKGIRIPGIQVRYLGRAPAPLSNEHLLGNGFTIVVRDLTAGEVKAFRARLARTLENGLINYFDDQRFGSIANGQGLPGRSITHGDFEDAVRRLIGTPGKRDPLSEQKFKKLVKKCWGDWELIAAKWGNRRGAAMVRYLRSHPTDYAGALRKLPGMERAIHIFAYQSLIWNNAVALYLTEKLPPHKRSSTKYVAGRHVWRECEDPPELVETFPLLDHTVEPEDPAVRTAIDAALAAEGLTIPKFKVDGIRGCFYKAVERPLVVRPTDLQLLGEEEDDRRPGRRKVRLSFELPPGAYATLVLKRLFGRAPDKAGQKPKKQRKRKSRKGKGKGKSRGRGKKKKKKG